MGLIIDIFACLTDNYGFLVQDQASGFVALIDAPEPKRISERMRELGLDRLDFILNTHWHPDHAGGNALLKAKYGAKILGPAEVSRIAPLDVALSPGTSFKLGGTTFDVLDLKGHTLGHIGYFDRHGGHAFIGDCLFPLGCGRLFEGSADDMWASLTRLMELPDTTKLYCAHEYTLANLRFAESLGMDEDLRARGQTLRQKRATGAFTVPSNVGEERLTNPFIVYPSREADFKAQAVKFGDLRAAKDQF